MLAGLFLLVFLAFPVSTGHLNSLTYDILPCITPSFWFYCHISFYWLWSSWLLYRPLWLHLVHQIIRIISNPISLIYLNLQVSFTIVMYSRNEILDIFEESLFSLPCIVYKLHVHNTSPLSRIVCDIVLRDVTKFGNL